MAENALSQTGSIEPIFVSVKEAAAILGLSTWEVYDLTSGDEPKIAVRFHGKRKLVSVASLREFADSLADRRPEAS